MCKCNYVFIYVYIYMHICKFSLYMSMCVYNYAYIYSEHTCKYVVWVFVKYNPLTHGSVCKWDISRISELWHFDSENDD